MNLSVRPLGIILKPLSNHDLSFFKPSHDGSSSELRLSNHLAFENLFESTRFAVFATHIDDAFPSEWEFEKNGYWCVRQTALKHPRSEAVDELDWFAAKIEINRSGQLFCSWRLVKQASQKVTWQVIATATRHLLRSDMVSLAASDLFYDAIDWKIFDRKPASTIGISPADKPPGQQFQVIERNIIETQTAIEPVSDAGPEDDIGSPHQPQINVPTAEANPAVLNNWWKFPLALGKKLSEVSQRSTVKCAALLPVLDYSAAVVATGFLLRRGELDHKREASLDAKLYFESIAELPFGAKVLVEYGGEIIVGKMRGKGRERGRPFVYVGYEIAGAHYRDQYFEETIRKIVPTDSDVIDAIEEDPGYLRRVSKIANHETTSLMNLMMLTANRLASLYVVGEMSGLAAEASENIGSVIPLEENVEATFNDVIQLDKSRTSTVSKANVIPLSGNLSRSFGKGDLIILRGSKAFLRHAHELPDISWVALLGSTEPARDRAVELFNSMYVQSGGQTTPEEWPVPMRGAEFMVLRG